MKKLANEIVAWLKDYAVTNKRNAFVVGVSGGVDSGLVSTLCAMTGLPTYVVTLPCQSKQNGLDNANLHVQWLKESFTNVTSNDIDLTTTFETFVKSLPPSLKNDLGFANAKSRLRMIALYQVATVYGGLVVGTGNKVEDFGVGFFTKYGDGGVDISPIADLTKTEVRAMAAALGIAPAVAQAVPTDGLWADNRTDEEQLGATYEELEWAMTAIANAPWDEAGLEPDWKDNFTPRQKEVMAVYTKWHNAGAHKLAPIPTFVRK